MFDRIVLPANLALLFVFVFSQAHATRELGGRPVLSCSELVASSRPFEGERRSSDSYLVNEEVFKALLTPLHLRSQAQLQMVNRYKNYRFFATSPVFRDYSGKTVDLKSPDLQKASDALKMLRPPTRNNSSETRWRATRYDEVILTLQAGDTIIYDEEQIQLGEFIKAGNKCHLYGVANNPDWAIRIPFSAAGMGIKARQFTLNYQVNTTQFPQDIPQVQVKPRPHGAFTLVSRVQGNEDGKTFLLSEGSITAAKLQKKKRLILLVDRLLQSDVARNQVSHFLRIDMARYFLWDQVKQDWILIGF
jgi:hypothetical protein